MILFIFMRLGPKSYLGFLLFFKKKLFYLQNFFEDWSLAQKKKKISIIFLSKKIECDIIHELE